MNRAAFSVFVWGIYMIFSGLGFLLIPNFLLPRFGFSPTTDGWVRVLGLLVAIVGAYYWYCARKNDLYFCRATVVGRLVFELGTVTLVLLGLAEEPLLLIGGMDACGAIWTWLALRSMGEMKLQGAPANA